MFEQMHDAGIEPPAEALIGERDVVFDGQPIRTTVYERKSLLAGNRIAGPSIIVEYTSTTVVPPFAQASIDKYGNLVLTISTDSVKS